MALFKKDKKQQENKEQTATQQNQVAAAAREDLSWVLLRPHLSEKSLILTDKKVYVFEVHKDANKSQIKKAIKQVYNVEPVKVNVVRMPRKRVVSWKTGIKGVKSQTKKAYVYLKKEDSISFV